MLKLSFQFGGAMITVRRADVRARLLQTRAYRNFDLHDDMDEGEFLAIQLFVQFLTQATVEGDLGFPVPSPTAPRADILAAYEAFMALPSTFYDLYLPIRLQVDGLIGDPELAAPPDEKKSAANG